MSSTQESIQPTPDFYNPVSAEKSEGLLLKPPSGYAAKSRVLRWKFARAELKNRRDTNRHAKIYWDEIYSEDERDMMRQVVTSLIPSIHFSDIAPQVAHEENVFDERMEAMLSLQKVFGIPEFNGFDGILKEHLLHAESFWLNVRPRDTAGGAARIDALYFVNDLYAATQCAFRPFLDRERPQGFSLEKVGRKTKSVGLGELPVSLRTVRDSMLQRTLAGDDQTLGASVVIWIFVSDTATLHRVAVKQPSFLSDVDKLLALSKHANQVCMMRADGIGQVRESSYKLIKTITEE